MNHVRPLSLNRCLALVHAIGCEIDGALEWRQDPDGGRPTVPGHPETIGLERGVEPVRMKPFERPIVRLPLQQPANKCGSSAHF